MGCDIHMYPEVKQGNYWRFAWRLDPNDKIYVARNYYPPRDFANTYAWDDRWYWLFGQLAGVRREGPPIAEPRGVPADVSCEVKSEMEDPDYHTHSWLTLKELQAHPWEERYTVYGGPIEDVKYIREWLARLATLDPDPENVRIVFAFDN